MLRRLIESLTHPRAGTPRRSRPTGPPQGAAARRWGGSVSFAYAPEADGAPDPGEVVWTWVPYEEDPSQGKDRPVVVLGVAAPDLLAVVPLSSKDHDGDPGWLPIGTGAWDPVRRPSSVRLDFVLAVPPAAVRREGSALDRRRYDQVVAALRAQHGW